MPGAEGEPSGAGDSAARRRAAASEKRRQRLLKNGTNRLAFITGNEGNPAPAPTSVPGPSNPNPADGRGARAGDRGPEVGREGERPPTPAASTPPTAATASSEPRRRNPAVASRAVAGGGNKGAAGAERAAGRVAASSSAAGKEAAAAAAPTPPPPLPSKLAPPTRARAIHRAIDSTAALRPVLAALVAAVIGLCYGGACAGGALGAVAEMPVLPSFLALEACLVGGGYMLLGWLPAPARRGGEGGVVRSVALAMGLGGVLDLGTAYARALAAVGDDAAIFGAVLILSAAIPPSATSH